MAFPTVQATNTSSTNTAGTNHVVSLPSGIVAGDLILICMSIGSTAATLNAHGSYTELLDENSAVGLKILYRWATGGETNPTLVSSASTRDATCTFRISGAKNPSAQAPQIGTTSSGSSTTPDPPSSAAPSETKDFLFVTFCGSAGEQADDGTYCTGFPANYADSNLEKTCGTAGTNLGGMIAAASRQLNTGSAQDPGTFTVSENNTWRAQTIMVHPPTNTTVTPDILALTTTTFVPSVLAPRLVTPSIATLTTSTFAPTVTTGNPILVTPGIVALSISTFAPTVSAPRLVTPGTLAMTVSTFAPTVTAPQTCTPGTASLTTSTFAPSVQAPRLVTPGTLAMTTSTFAPAVSTPRLVTPDTAVLSLVGFAGTTKITV